MSQDNLQFVTCPHCHQTTAAEPLAVIREGTSDVDSLFDGSLNRFTCTECQQSFLFEGPLLYRDDAQRFIAYYLPKALVANLDDALQQMDKLYQSIFGEFEAEERPTCRLATQRGHFIEKIAVHQFEYDDRIIEYTKYLLFQHNKGLDAVRHELLFDFGNSDDENIMFLAYSREQGKPEYSLGLTVEDYQELEESMFATPEMEAQLEGLFRPYLVSVDDLLK